jgi:hypothetical protein
MVNKTNTYEFFGSDPRTKERFIEVHRHTETRKPPGLAGFLLSKEVQQNAVAYTVNSDTRESGAKTYHCESLSVSSMAKNLNKDTVYRAAKPKDKDYTINDGECLMMLVKANGSKLWRFIYRFKGKQNRLDFAS